MREARLLGDQVDGEIRLAEEALHLAEAHAENLVLR